MMQPGLAASVELRVGRADTAEALRSGDVPVLGTPRLLALIEEAAVKAVAGHLESGQTTVGVSAELEHLAPTAVGRMVTADARLTAVDGSKLDFVATVSDGAAEVARATHRRVVVDRERFLTRLR